MNTETRRSIIFQIGGIHGVFLCFLSSCRTFTSVVSWESIPGDENFKIPAWHLLQDCGNSTKLCMYIVYIYIYIYIQNIQICIIRDNTLIKNNIYIYIYIGFGLFALTVTTILTTIWSTPQNTKNHTHPTTICEDFLILS